MAEVIEHEQHSSGVAKAGLVTGIVGATGTALGAMKEMGIFGGGKKQQEQINALRDENILLKSEKATSEQVNSINVKLAVIEERQAAMRTEFGQALQLEATHRANGDQNLRQYVDDNFLKAGKYLDAQRITPPVSVWPYNTPSFAQYVFPAPPFPPPVPPTQQPANGSGSNTPNNTNG